ncbi:hypothetical protein TrispH2_009774 [Trichoplax sp. H2]|nr:hypothetical protein TrispH2_009774 [Trichoplax sp. H2]|eukprot:RDD38423.1 hypothetical protein TrispH2_009774 [Trichoplax sp. H2]
MELDFNQLSIREAKDIIEKLKKECNKLDQHLQLLTWVEDCYQEKKRIISKENQSLHTQLLSNTAINDDDNERLREIYDVMVRNYRLEQTVSEMKKVLIHSQLSKEISLLGQAMKETTETFSMGEMNAMTLLQSWYWMIIAYDRSQHDIVSDSPSGNSTIQDKLFYYVSHHVQSKPLQSDKTMRSETSPFLSELSFTTRRNGICIGITLRCPNLPRQAITADHEGFISVSSDLPVPNIGEQGKAYLLAGKNPATFIQDIIWDWIDKVKTTT